MRRQFPGLGKKPKKQIIKDRTAGEKKEKKERRKKNIYPHGELYLIVVIENNLPDILHNSCCYFSRQF